MKGDFYFPSFFLSFSFLSEMSSSSSPSSSSSIPTESGKASTSPPLWQSSPSKTVARVASLVEFIQKYTWLADLYFVEFYSENLQSLFPPEWIQALLFDKTLTLAEFDTFMGTQKLGVSPSCLLLSWRFFPN